MDSASVALPRVRESQPQVLSFNHILDLHGNMDGQLDQTSRAGMLGRSLDQRLRHPEVCLSIRVHPKPVQVANIGPRLHRRDRPYDPASRFGNQHTLTLGAKRLADLLFPVRLVGDVTGKQALFDQTLKVWRRRPADTAVQ